jgi:hypothetical protein
LRWVRLLIESRAIWCFRRGFVAILSFVTGVANISPAAIGGHLLVRSVLGDEESVADRIRGDEL